MPEIQTLFLVFSAGLLLAMTPGPDLMLVIARGSGQGRRVALATSLGVSGAGVIQLPMLAFGMSALIAEFPALLGTIRILGAGYMVYLGVQMYLSARPAQHIDINAKNQLGQAFREGFISNLFNPKVIMFQLSFLPQFVQPDAGLVWAQLLVFGVLTKTAGLLVSIVAAFVSGSLGNFFRRNPTFAVWQTRMSGCIVASLGGLLLFQRN